MSAKRDRLQVIHDILKAIQDKNGLIKPTHILYKANLSSQMLSEYLRDLIEREFIVETPTTRGRTYSLTEKGFHYLREYKTIVEFIDVFGLG